MNFEELSPVKRVFVIFLLATGLVLSVRLVLIAAGPWRRGEPETMEEFREKMQKAAQFEREQTKKMWIESGKPLPPGGYEEVWRRAHGQSSEEFPVGTEAE